MLTRLRIRNFKRFPEAEIELGQAVVFIGQNNSGKTTALQALALWEVGLRKWTLEYKGKSVPAQRPGVTINRRDLVAIPVPGANFLWRNLHVRDVKKVNGKPQTQNIRIDVIVDGVNDGVQWSCGLEFDYANEESFYCRPLRLDIEKQPSRMPVPKEAADTRVAFLPPMSGLAASEPKWEAGRINVLLGEGQTAQVLRNLCHQLYDQPEPRPAWRSVRMLRSVSCDNTTMGRFCERQHPNLDALQMPLLRNAWFPATEQMQIITVPSEPPYLRWTANIPTRFVTRRYNARANRRARNRVKHPLPGACVVLGFCLVPSLHYFCGG